MYGDSSGISGMEAKSDHTKVSAMVVANCPAAFLSVNNISNVI